MWTATSSSIQLNNYGTKDAVCSVTLPTVRNHPVDARSRYRRVKSTNTTVKFNRAIIKMRIALALRPEIKQQPERPDGNTPLINKFLDGL